MKNFSEQVLYFLFYKKFVIFNHVQENARTFNNKKQMRFNCKYGYECDSRSTGKRINK